jgi:hypothetical protein
MQEHGRRHGSVMLEETVAAPPAVAAASERKLKLIRLLEIKGS